MKKNKIKKAIIILVSGFGTVLCLFYLFLHKENREISDFRNRPEPNIIEGWPNAHGSLSDMVLQKIPFQERASKKLKITKKNGRYYWASQNNRELTRISGEGPDIYFEPKDTNLANHKIKYTIFTSVDLDGFIIIKHDDIIQYDKDLRAYRCVGPQAYYLEFQFFKSAQPSQYKGSFNIGSVPGDMDAPLTYSFYPPVKENICKFSLAIEEKIRVLNDTY